MNNKQFDEYKELFFELCGQIPIGKLEKYIITHENDLTKDLYQALNNTLKNIEHPRYKSIVRAVGIIAIFNLYDPCYGDVFRYLIKQLDLNFDVKNPRDWRINLFQKEHPLSIEMWKNEIKERARHVRQI